MGYLKNYAGYPMHWTSKMQTEIALSTTEAEYIALSQSMREVLPIMWLCKAQRNTSTKCKTRDTLQSL